MVSQLSRPAPGRMIPEKFLKQIEAKVQVAYRTGMAHGFGWGAACGLVGGLVLICFLDLLMRRR